MGLADLIEDDDNELLKNIPGAQFYFTYELSSDSYDDITGTDRCDENGDEIEEVLTCTSFFSKN
ncbi:MAG: hypothetical protein WCT23_09640 [Candidatus Neomarinimicrobiota bacterium]